MKATVKLSVFLLALITMLSSCSFITFIFTDNFATTSSSQASSSESEITSSSETSETVTTDAVTTEPEPEVFSLSILAVGDNLIHGNLIKAGKKFGYDSLYASMADTISAADLSIINQETIFTYDADLYSGYPRFASPIDVGIAALNAGFDVFSTSTNHTCDRGKQPMLDTIDFWKHHPEGICVGLHETQEDYNTVKIIEVNHIKIALFNYTYGFNHTCPVWWMVETLSNKERMEEQFAYAEENADFIIVMPHWGKEYVHKPNSTQVSWAQYFADLGADLIIGTHPHVVQPVMELTGKDGNTTVCYYSLGNFISNQNDFNANIGGLASVNVIKDENGTRIDSYELIATTVLVEDVGGTWKYSPMLLSDLTDELLLKSVKFSNKSVQDFWDLFNKAIKSYP